MHSLIFLRHGVGIALIGAALIDELSDMVSERVLTQCLLVIADKARVLALLTSAALFAGCASPSGARNAEDDASSRVVAITAASLPLPQLDARSTDERIVALANGSAEIVYALGFGAALVGRDIASAFPGDDRVPIVTSAHTVSAEKVLTQRPTTILIDARTGPQEALRQIRSAGVRLREIPEAWTLADMAARIRAIGAALGVADAAETLIQRDQAKRANLRTSGDGTRVAFLYLRGSSSIYLLGGAGSGADSLMQELGAVDVGAEAGLPAFTALTSEALIRAKPDILLVMRKGLQSVGGVDGLVGLPGVAQTPAGIARRVIAVDDEVLLAFGPRTGALLVALADAIRQVQ